MSIIIKGIDMPKDLTAMTVIMHGLNFDYSQTVYRDKIVEIPTPHGRLIEGDRLIRELSVIADRPIRSGMYIIKEAPTILEAEE